MKGTKLLAALLSGAMAMSNLLLFPVANAEVVEIFNDGFENGDSCGWTPRGDETILSVTEEAAYSGTGSLKISNRTQNWNGAGCSKVLELRAGYTYDLSCWVMYDDETAGTTQQINLQVLYTDSETGKENYKYVAGKTVNVGEWTEIRNTAYTVPETANGITLYVEAPNNLNFDFYIDEVTANGEPYTGEDPDGFFDDFEDGTLQDWSARGSSSVSVVDTYAHDSTYSLYTSGRTQLWNGPQSNKSIVLELGGYYKFSVWVMYNGDAWTDTAGFQLYLQYDQNGETKYNALNAGTGAKGEWIYIEGKVTIPDDVSNLIVYVQPQWSSAPSDQDNTIDFYIDDVVGERLPDPAIQKDIASLYETYADYFKIGGAATASELATPASKDLILKHYNSLTFGNELKPNSTLDQAASIAYMNANGGDQTNPQVKLDDAKTLLEFCAENNMPVRGHVLVWHSQTPDWFFKENYSDTGAWVSEEVMLKRLENYIKNLMNKLATEYPDVEFYAWDVVNEAVSDAGGIREPGSNNEVSGQSAWVQVFGDQSYIPYAFEYARKYAPEGCKLFYNDYNEYVPEKRDTIYEICADLADKGLIDGVGMQSHIKMGYPSIDLYEEAIRKYASLGVEVQITELDIDQKSNTAEDQLALAERYRAVFELFKKMKDAGIPLTAVVLWGVTDSTSWIGGYPLLFDGDYQAKPAYYAVIDTDAPIQTIQTANAIQYDGTAADLEQAFEVQAAQSVGSAGSFKLAWNGAELVIRVTARTAGEVRIMSDAFTTVTESITAGTTDIPVTIGTSVSSIRFDIDINGTAWNSMNGYVGVTAGNEDADAFGKVKLAQMPAYAEAAYGTPEIDGTIDSVWSNATAIDCATYTLGSGATAKARMLWDKNNIYVLMEVTDPVLSAASANAYEQDTVEVFFDENNHKFSTYESDDIQCRVNYLNDKTVTDGRSTDEFVSAAATVSGGYLVELAIPYTIAPLKNGQVVGFDVQVNDDGVGEGERTSISNWSDLTGQGYINTSGFGVLKLVGGTTSGTLKGDVNLDGMVAVSDLVLLARYVSQDDEVGALSSDAIANADVNGDSACSADDISDLSLYLAGMTAL